MTSSMDVHVARCRLERVLDDEWDRVASSKREFFKLQEELAAARNFVKVGEKRFKAIQEELLGIEALNKAAAAGKNSVCARREVD